MVFGSLEPLIWHRSGSLPGRVAESTGVRRLPTGRQQSQIELQKLITQK
jgi:hypothetical protein